MLVTLLRGFLRPYRTAVLAVLGLQVIQGLATLYLPYLNADIIDGGIIKGDIRYILTVGGIMVAVALGQVICAIGAYSGGAYVALSAGRDIRAALFGRVQDFSGREVAQFGIGSLITRTTNDVQQVQMLTLMSLTVLAAAPVICLGGIVLALQQDIPLSGVLVAAVVVLGVAVFLIISRMRPLYRLMQARIDRINRMVRDQIIGVRVIRAFVREDTERERFTTASTDLLDVSLAAGKMVALLIPVMGLILNIAIVAVVWFGAHRVADGSLQIGALAAFIGYLSQILVAVMLASLMFVMLPRAEVCADRISAVLDTDSSVAAPAEPARLQAAEIGDVALANAEFRYPGAEEPVLRGLDLVARAGQTTAVVGSTGSGKTTLLSVIDRLFDVTAGQVRIGGTDLRDIDPAQLPELIALVPQQAYLFSGTVASNLRYGRLDATDEELWHALEVAQAADFVRELRDGLGAPVAQGGTNISGGQRQRLTIARAVLSRARICLFDDSFSALDYTTAAALKQALATELAGRIVIVVSQRISTIRDAQQIVVLDNGRVAASGTHAELMQSSQTYREIALSQLTEQEVM
jgi:ATP-binding cassette, subfamily B, multidrug efflux pump